MKISHFKKKYGQIKVLIFILIQIKFLHHFILFCGTNYFIINLSKKIICILEIKLRKSIYFLHLFL